jgi:hypothetical protein
VLIAWATDYSVQWIRLAIIEALYQGRYKAVSVEQILQQWQRRGNAQPHFDTAFEKLICDRFPRNLMAEPPVPESAITALAAEIHANTTAKSAEIKASGEAALAALTRFVQNRKSLQPNVDAVINSAESNIDRVADQAKQQVIGKLEETSREIDARSIHQFTPENTAPEVIAKLRAVSGMES